MISSTGLNNESSGSKRKALEMLTNIFCKKTKENENGTSNSSFESNSDEVTRPNVYLTSQNHLSISSLNNSANFIPKSPISPRVKNIREDLEALTLSRQDNPYIMQQLERLSFGGDLRAEISLSSQPSPAKSLCRSSVTASDGHSRYEPVSISMEIEEILEDESLHEKLIRSPPPNFPQKLSCFIYPADSIGNMHNCTSPSHQYLTPTNSLPDRITKNQDAVSSKSNFSDVKYERRGSDSSIAMFYQWKNAFCDRNLTASSCSLLQSISNVKSLPLNSSTTNENENQVFQADDDQALCDDQNLFLSPSNSSEALLKDNANDV